MERRKKQGGSIEEDNKAKLKKKRTFSLNFESTRIIYKIS